MTDFSRLSALFANRLQQSSAMHERFLRARQKGLQGMQSLLEQQIYAKAGEQAPLYRSEQLDAFGFGRYSECFGPAFARYDGRRIPRIPNGDLKMMSRVTAIEGQPGTVRPPATVTVAYDVPVDAWYLRESPEIPYALWMEIALQPCGFLSAYLDTYALVPDQEYFFRNLDGSAQLLARIDPRGLTLVTHARLLSSVASTGTVIQKYAFSVQAEEQTVFEGESTFGYFSTDMMRKQQGLDGGSQTQTWLHSQKVPAQQIALPGPRTRLRQLDGAALVPNGGLHGAGYISAQQPVDPQGWFFPYHFDGDPVMPGSLGVEAVFELLRIFAVQQYGAPARQALVQTGPDCTFQWRYRGQITREHQRIWLEAHVHPVDQRGTETHLRADGSLWVDGLRIYEVKNAAIVWNG